MNCESVVLHLGSCFDQCETTALHSVKKRELAEGIEGKYFSNYAKNKIETSKLMYLLPDRATSYIGNISTIFIVSQADPSTSFIPGVSAVVVGFFSFISSLIPYSHSKEMEARWECMAKDTALSSFESV